MKRIRLFLILMSFVGLTNAAVYYVGPSGNNSTGLSWANAYQTIQGALVTSKIGDEIWVAQGTYVIKDASTQLVMKEGVNVFGGFTGTEVSKNNRNMDPSLTKICHTDTLTVKFRLLYSSDLNELTTWDGFTFDGKNLGLGVTLAGNCVLNNSIIKNCLAINESGIGVLMSSISELVPIVLSNSKILNNTLKVSIDNIIPLGGAGVSVRSGAKLAEISNCEISNNTIEGISEAGNLEAMGAGIYAYQGVIRNCKLDNNKLINSVNKNYNSYYFTGGAIAIVPQKIDLPANQLLIEGCVITNSISPSRGGAIIIDPRWSGQYHGNYTISKTVISNNKSTNGPGGGIFATGSTAQTGNGWTLNILNSVISNNSSSDASGGGGLYVNIGSVLNITNSTFVKNFAGDFGFGGAGLFLQGTATHRIKTTIKNSIFWGNEAPGRAADQVQVKINGQAATMIFSAIQDYEPTAVQYKASTFGDNFNLSANNSDAEGPGLMSPSTTVGYNVAGVPSANWRLTSSSICVDAGDDFLIDDIVGTKRPQGDYSDVGAYEFVEASATPNNKENLSSIQTISGAIVFNNLDGFKQLNIFNVVGSLIKSVSLAEGVNTIQLPHNHIYIVKSNNFVSKVIVK